MYYTISQVARLIDARQTGNTDAELQWLLTDSRSLAYPESSLFFALRTRTGDGHRYLAELYRRGVRNFVVSALPAESPAATAAAFLDAAFLVVPSPFESLQRLAAHHRERFAIPVVGITGSNGKTIVKEWIYQLLGYAPDVTRSPRSYNSQIGVPLSVWMLNDESRLGVFEAGISCPGEMAALRRIVRPTLGVLTHIGPAHQENFSTMEEKCMEKLSLFCDVEELICCIDNDVVEECVSASAFGKRAVTWTRSNKPATYAVKVHHERGAVRIDCTTTATGSCSHFRIPFSDAASVENAVHAILAVKRLAGRYAGVPTDEVLAARTEQLQPVAMRLEVKGGVRGLTLIDDAYNSDLASLDIALDFLARRKEQKRAVVILSDLQQTGENDAALYARVAQLLVRRGVDRLIGIGAHLSTAASFFSSDAAFFSTTQALLDSGLLDTLSDAVVLLKGARDFHFELIADELQRQVHETTLEVNLGALAENLRHYRSFMQPSTKLTCMVKADAYGSGSVEVARTLQELGADYLAVAVADEGVALRKAGIRAGILVMNPEMSALHTLFKYRLEPEIYSFRLLDALIDAARREGVTHFPIHIKLDTGMCRLGFHPEHDIEALVARFRAQQALAPRSVFSHFVGSDSPDFDAFSRLQFARFDAASRRLQSAFPHRILRHICNSAAIARFPDYHLDMCRLGLGLYGVDPTDGHLLSNVASLHTTILQIREVDAGTSIGYSRRTVVDRPSRIAVLPIGYADGLDRHLGNRGGYCLVGNRQAPYVGNICMDVCMVDVTDVDCCEGDPVEIFGDRLSVSELARRLDTIPYEVLTSVSERVKRVYFQ